MAYESISANFYMVKVEVVRIGTSPAAPILTVIVGPSEEGKEIGRTKMELADQHNIQHAWWSHLLSLPEAKLHAHLTPSSVNWVSVASGIRGLAFNYVVKQNSSVAELYIDRGKGAAEINKAIFDQLHSQKEEIEAEFGSALSWERLDARRGCRICREVAGGYRSEADEWGAIQGNLVATMNRLHAVLQPRILKLQMAA